MSSIQKEFFVFLDITLGLNNGLSCVLSGNWGHAGTGFWKGLAGRFDSFPVVRKMMFVRLRSDLNPLALTMAA